ELGVELTDLETCQLTIVQRFRNQHQRVRAVQQECPSIGEMVQRSIGLQHRLNELLSEHRYLQLRAGLDKKGKLRLDSCCGEGGAWLTCVCPRHRSRIWAGRLQTASVGATWHGSAHAHADALCVQAWQHRHGGLSPDSTVPSGQPAI